MLRCPTCNGTKRIAPLGGIYKPCTICKGTGMITEPAVISAQAYQIQKPIKVTAEHIIETPIVKKKPGRKPFSIPTIQTAV